ncbi:MAG: hypothetical protein R3Y60_00870 [bacterium]
MKKLPLKRLLSFGLVLFLTVTLGACSSKDTYSTETPYGNIDGVYATNNGDELTNKQLYDLIRPSSYSLFYNELEKTILSNYLSEDDAVQDFYTTLDFNEDYEDMQQLIIETIFNCDEMDDVKKLTSTDFSDILTQLTDSLYVSNINVDASQIYISGDTLVFPKELFDFFKLDLAKRNFGEYKLTEIIARGEYYDEEVEDEDGEVTTEEVENTYYISDEDIENYYNNTYRHQQDYNAVIVGFNTLQEYSDAMAAARYSGGTYYYIDSNTASYYARLYNNAYDYKQSLTYSTGATASTLIAQGATTVNADKLTAFNADLASFVANMEAEQYTTTYKEFGGKYYMVYKLNDLSDDEWEDLTTEQQNALYDDLYLELFDSKLSDSFIIGQVSEILNDIAADDNMVINDPVFGLMFAAQNADFTYELENLTDKMNVATFTYNETEYKVTVDELFEVAAKYYGVNTAVSYFTNLAVSKSDLMDSIDDDNEDDAQDAYDAEVAKYKNGEYASNGITSAFELEEFLLIKFGFDNATDVMDYYFLPQQAIANLSEINNDFYFDLLYLSGQNNFNNYFSLDIKHVLLFVDFDLDGTLDDPNDFIRQLNEEDPTGTSASNFKKAIVKIYATIYDEADALSGSLSDNLDKIVRMYNNNSELASNSSFESTTWKTVKNYYGDFNIQIKVEDLGTVDNASASSYVTEFSEHVENFYLEISKDAKKELSDSGITVEDEDYYDELLDTLSDLLDEPRLENIKTTTSFDNLCMSSFGFHMLLSKGGETSTSSVFTDEQDYKADSEDEYMIYENIIVYDNDGEELQLNGYSDTAWPSMNQLKVYVYELDSDDGVESLRSTTETIISSFYSTFTTRYTDATFTNYVIYQMLDMDIQFNDTTIDTDMIDNFFEIAKNQLDSYEDTSANSTHTYAGWWEYVESYDFSSKAE